MHFLLFWGNVFVKKDEGRFVWKRHLVFTVRPKQIASGEFCFQEIASKQAIPC